MTPTTTLTVQIAGARTGTAPLTWGQRLIWDSMAQKSWNQPMFNNGGLAPVPPGRDTDAVLDAIGLFLTTHETFRTVYRSTEGGPRQVLGGAGVVPVPVYEVGEGDAQAVADEIVVRLRAHPFQVDTDWPVRLAVVTVGGVPVFVAVAFHRFTLDREGTQLAAEHMRRLLAGERPMPPRVRPLDQALYERSPVGEAANAAAIDRLREVLAGAPPTNYDFAPGPEIGTRMVQHTMRSGAAELAAELIAARLRLSSSAVLLAATAIALSRYTGHVRIVTRLLFANRADDRLRDLLGTTTTEVPAVLDAGGPVAEVARRAFEVTVAAQLASAHDPAALEELRRELRLAHGAHVDLATVFNDGRPERVPASMTAGVTADDVRRLVPRTVVRAGGAWNRWFGRFQVIAEGLPGEFALSTWCDPRYVQPSTVEEILRGIERLLVAACGAGPDEGEALAGLPVAPRGPGWVRCRDGWVDLPAAGTMWSRVTGGGGRLFAEPEPGFELGSAPGAAEHRMVAYCAGADTGTVAELHRRFVAALGERADVRAADRYVRCATAPADPTDRRSWDELPVLERGDGRSAR